MGVDWNTLAAATMVIAGAAGAAALVLHAKMSNWFVTRQEHATMDERVTGVEAKLRDAPSQGDLRAILDQLAAGKGRFDTLSAQIDGVGRSIGRVEGQLDMMMRAQLERERGATS